MIHAEVIRDSDAEGRQPWDDIVDEGWAPEVCAGMVLKYLRRSKEPGHSLESAWWYHARLLELSRGELLPVGTVKPSHRQRAVGRASAVLVRLYELLTPEERALFT